MKYIKQDRVVQLLTIYECETVEDALTVVNTMVDQKDIYEPREKPCPWCRDKDEEWTVIDEDFCQPVSRKLVKYCFSCGRKINE